MRERLITSEAHAVYGSLPEFLEAPECVPGVLTIMHGGVPLDVKYDPRGYGTTMVFFHAAVSRRFTQLPMFPGAGISQRLPVDRIFITDPTLYLDDDLTLGWFAGNRCQPDLQDVITKVLAALIPKGRPAVMFGGSGGGFAALHYAARIPNSLAVPVNPQIKIGNFSKALVDAWLRLGWGLDTSSTGISDVATETDAGRAYVEGSPTRVWYIQNTGDTRHVKKHFTPFMDALPPGHAVSPFLVDAGPGHVRPPKEVLKEVLAAAIDGEARPPRPEDLAAYQQAPFQVEATAE
ncbi:hypothetical protein [Brachybacterium sp. AOP3-A1-3]|uniref:hypothetical protein n=1 Tax=Brachybacterium sp. AOP3-A1-3 TaxID=3457699 RepID=UPI0040341623